MLIEVAPVIMAHLVNELKLLREMILERQKQLEIRTRRPSSPRSRRKEANARTIRIFIKSQLERVVERYEWYLGSIERMLILANKVELS